MKVKFEYLISGKTENSRGKVVGEGKDYDASIQNAYDNVCAETHNPYLTITFKKVD